MLGKYKVTETTPKTCNSYWSACRISSLFQEFSLVLFVPPPTPASAVPHQGHQILNDFSEHFPDIFIIYRKFPSVVEYRFCWDYLNKFLIDSFYMLLSCLCKTLDRKSHKRSERTLFQGLGSIIFDDYECDAATRWSWLTISIAIHLFRLFWTDESLRFWLRKKRDEIFCKLI